MQKQNIVADINMDMFPPHFPPRYLEAQGLAEPTLGADIRDICQKAGVVAQADKEPDRNLIIRGAGRTGTKDRPKWNDSSFFRRFAGSGNE